MYSILATSALFLGLILAEENYGTTSPAKTTYPATCTVTATATSLCGFYPCNVGPQPTTITTTVTDYEACSNCALTTITRPGPCPVPPPEPFTISCPATRTKTSTAFACATCTKTVTAGFTCPPACNVGKPTETVNFQTVSYENCSGNCALVTQTAHDPCPAVPPASVTAITCPGKVSTTHTYFSCGPTPTPL